MPESLPTNNDIDALYQLAFDLGRPMLYQGGDTRELFSTNAPRDLRVWWGGGVEGCDSGWAFETKRRHAVVDCGRIDTVAELRGLLVWVEGERAELAALVAGEAG